MGKNLFELPNYPVAPLKDDEIIVAAVQMNPVLLDPKDPKPGIKRNLDHMLRLCDSAATWPPQIIGGQLAKTHLLAFVEFTITGIGMNWTREDYLRASIMVPGPETEAIGEKAKELGCYIAFGSYTQDEEWPDHFFNSSLIVSPEGKVIHNHWKAINGFPGAFGIEYSTTVHEVYDAFIEKHGWEAVWPVARTEIGNLGTYICSEGFNPETARALAFNGAEILIRMSGALGPIHHCPMIGDQTIGFRADCQASGVYGVYSNGGSGWWAVQENAEGGGSMIVDPRGVILNKAQDSRETIVKTSIPIATFRKSHSIPAWVRTELYAPVYNRPSPCGSNLYADYLPTDIEDAQRISMESAMKRMKEL